MTYSITTLNSIPAQGLSAFDVITFGTTLNSKTITQDDFTADSYDESAFPRVLGVEGKFKENLTVGNVFSLVPEGGGNSAGAILEANTRLANNYVDPSGSGNDVQTSDNKLTQRTARVRLKIDYTNSEAYAAAQDYLEWLDYADNGPDGWPTDEDDQAVNRNKALTPDDPDNYVSYAVVTRCPSLLSGDFGAPMLVAYHDLMLMVTHTAMRPCTIKPGSNFLTQIVTLMLAEA